MKTIRLRRGDLVAKDGVLFMPEANNENEFLLRAMDLCGTVFNQEKSSARELARALHVALGELARGGASQQSAIRAGLFAGVEKMRRPIARWLGIRYMGYREAVLLLGKHHDILSESAKIWHAGKEIPNELLQKMAVSHNTIFQALTRGV